MTCQWPMAWWYDNDDMSMWPWHDNTDKAATAPSGWWQWWQVTHGQCHSNMTPTMMTRRWRWPQNDDNGDDVAMQVQCKQWHRIYRLYYILCGTIYANITYIVHMLGLTQKPVLTGFLMVLQMTLQARQLQLHDREIAKTTTAVSVWNGCGCSSVAVFYQFANQTFKHYLWRMVKVSLFAEIQPAISNFILWNGILSLECNFWGRSCHAGIHSFWMSCQLCIFSLGNPFRWPSLYIFGLLSAE